MSANITFSESALKEGEKIFEKVELAQELESRLNRILPRGKDNQKVAFTVPYDVCVQNGVKVKFNTGIPEEVLHAYSILVHNVLQKSPVSKTEESEEDSARCLKCIHIEGDDFDLEISMAKTESLEMCENKYPKSLNANKK